MERLTYHKEIGNRLIVDTDYFCDDQPFKISELELFLSKARSEGATHIKFNGEDEENIDSVYMQPIVLTEETDANFEIRENKEIAMLGQIKISQEANEKSVLAALKLKYPNL